MLKSKFKILISILVVVVIIGSCYGIYRIVENGKIDNKQNGSEESDSLKNIDNGSESETDDNITDDESNNNEDNQVNNNDNTVVQVIENNNKNNTNNNIIPVVNYSKPVVNFSKNGDSVLNTIQNITLSINGDYIDNMIFYAVENQNTSWPSLISWKKYNDNIKISNVDGKSYIWAIVLGKDGKYYYYCSNSFEMKKSWDTPQITFSKNGDEEENIYNSTQINISGDTVSNSVRYYVDTQNTIHPERTLSNWTTYNNNVELQGINGNNYIWVEVLGKDGNYYYNCSNMFNMAAEWDIPQVTFTRNGDLVENMYNSTEINLSGDYVSSTTRYYLDIQNTIHPDHLSSNWTSYTGNIELENLSGNIYVWVEVLGKDGIYHYMHSDAFKMIDSYTLGYNVYVSTPSSSDYSIPGIPPVTVTKINFNFKVTVNVNDIKKVEYCYFHEEPTAVTNDMYQEFTEEQYSKIGQNIAFEADNVESSQNTLYFFVKITDKYDQIYEQKIVRPY